MRIALVEFECEWLPVRVTSQRDVSPPAMTVQLISGAYISEVAPQR